MCDKCVLYENSKNNTELENHLLNVEEYRIAKNNFINSNSLCIEFDYFSNKALPKLNNSEFYYKRSLYLY